MHVSFGFSELTKMPEQPRKQLLDRDGDNPL